MRLVEDTRRLDEVSSRDHATGVFGTSHNACALAHFDSPATLGAEGVPIGPILSGGGLLCYDPFVIYNKRERFNVTNPNMAVTGELGQGKALDVDTPIPTPDGWSTMSALKPGDKVFSADGSITRILTTSAVMHDRACYAVDFSDGTTIVADREHLWATETWSERSVRRHGQSPVSRVVTTQEIATTLKKRPGNTQNNHAVKIAAPLVLPDRDLPVPPRLLGLWLGDGDSSGRGFTTADPELADEFTACTEVLWLGQKYRYAYRFRDHHPAERPVLACVACGSDIEPQKYRRTHCSRSCAKASYWAGRPPERRRCAVCRSDLPIETWHSTCAGCRQQSGWFGKLKALGVVGNKHIPVAYLRGSIDQRMELLSGLMDTDGYVTDGGVAIDVTNEALAMGIYELASSLGWRVACRIGRAKLNGRDCGPKWRLRWTPDQDVFRLRRKVQTHNQRRRKPQGNRNHYRYITAVRPVASRPVRCIKVEHPSGLFLASKAMIPTHNSTTVQVYLRRQHPFGRFIRVIDPSPMGEYHALCDDLGGQKIRVAKDGDVTLNPLESPATRHALLRSMAAATTGRALKEREPALLNTALDAAGDRPILPDVLNRLFYPTTEMAKRVGTTERQFAREARDLAMSLLTLCEGDLHGLFDGHTTADVDFSNRFILLDLSDLHDSQSLGILMACATSFLQAQIDAHYHQGQIIGQMPKSILVIDEAWKILALPGIGEWLIERIKFARKKAEQTVAIFHGLRDLDAAGDEGNRITKLAQGLVKDCGTFVIHKASLADARALQELLNLSDVERDIIVRNLDRGCALWRVGPHRFVAFTHATDDDLRVTSPDRAMTG